MRPRKRRKKRQERPASWRSATSVLRSGRRHRRLPGQSGRKRHKPRSISSGSAPINSPQFEHKTNAGGRGRHGRTENAIGARPARLSAPKPRDHHAPGPAGDRCSASAVRAPLEHRLYRRTLRAALYRAADVPGRAHGLCGPHHGRNRNHRAREGPECARSAACTGRRFPCPRAVSRRRIHRHQPGCPGRHFGLDPGPSADPDLDHRQSFHG